MWQVKINGVVLPESFDSEDAACQAAANIRGTDFAMKVEVSDKGFDKPVIETGRIDPDPKTTATAAKK